jgi:hypothetical protein
VLTFAESGAIAAGYSKGYSNRRSFKAKTGWIV